MLKDVTVDVLIKFYDHLYYYGQMPIICLGLGLSVPAESSTTACTFFTLVVRAALQVFGLAFGAFRLGSRVVFDFFDIFEAFSLFPATIQTADRTNIAREMAAINLD